MNKIMLVGRITKDLELKEVGEDKVPVVNFTIAVNSGINKNTGEKIVDFLPVSAWNKNAENLYKYTGKGTLISIIGSLRNRNFKISDGITKQIPEVRAERIQFLETKKREQEAKEVS
ncbi:single-stranded DNA-binding protein [Clostridium sediminicola]|uniref:single-stranded DNA-binding protein n=1 Tax=Clostridium sediminicola TaxID=3114879 RepID=UPI0031F24AF8